MRFLPILCTVFATLLPIAEATQLVPPDADDGRTSVMFPYDPFINSSAGEGSVRFLKFAIVLSEPGIVYFQDSEKYVFHYDFASERLQPCLEMTHTQFDAVALHTSGQQVVLGALLYGYRESVPELGIQFVGLDAYPREQIAGWFQTVRNAVQIDPEASIPEVFYIPTIEQRAVADAEKTWLESQSINVSSSERWTTGDQIYSPGWALGRLVYLPGTEINVAYGDGRLRHDDILITDGVPAEVPFVAGIVSLNPATPNSHVAILAKNQGIPFGYMREPSEQQAAQALNGLQVLLRIQESGINHGVSITETDQDLDPKLRSQILAYKKPARAKIVPRSKRNLLTQDVTNLTAADIRYFGGKAANFGYLRRSIPENSPHAIAFSFDLWTQFLANINPDTGLTLQQEIDQRLGQFQWPPNIAGARPLLEEIRTLIRKKVKFTDAQKSAITAALLSTGFTPARELRFRSSTNVEDSEVLTGAGLYESASGCLADSIDGNGEGPSHCCVDEPKEQTILDAVEKVFASFYNENAWLERLRHSVPEAHAGMGLIVHHNYPAEDELANGVVTLKRRDAFANRGGTKAMSFEGEIVSQLGDESVTNPDGGAKPEVVVVGQDGAEPYFSVTQYSNRLALGGHVMDWEADYGTLLGLLKQVAAAYGAANPAKHEFTLDFEFKKVRISSVETKIIVKQVRALATPQPKLVLPFILSDPSDYVVMQGEGQDVFAYHRLKATLHLETRNTRLSRPHLAAGLHKNSSAEWLRNGVVQQLTNGPRGWPAYSAINGVRAFTDRWAAGARAQRTTYLLRTSYGGKVDSTKDLIFTQRDFPHTWTAIYSQPQTYLDGNEIKNRRSDSVYLAPRSALVPQDTPQTRRLTHPDGPEINSAFFWEKSNTGGTIIKTFSIAQWQQTVITGLTTDPITLTNDYAQTYGPGHHNFFETFIFEPALDPTLTATQKAELATKNIRYFHIYYDGLENTTTWRFMGLDGILRPTL